MSNEECVVRAAPLKSNVAFVTRTSDDAGPGTSSKPNSGNSVGVVPGFGEADAPAIDQPCALKGLSGGLAAGMLGYVFGFVPAMLRHRGLKSLNIWGAEGLTSAKSFAVMSGIYTTVQCISERIRQQDDGINRIIAGGASGVAVAWRSGFVGALQSGVLLAVVSWVFDFGNGSVGSAKAAGLGCSSGSCGVSVGRFISCSDGGSNSISSTAGGAVRGSRPLHLQLGGAWRPTALKPEQILRTPPVMWLGPIVNRSYFSPPALSFHA